MMSSTTCGSITGIPGTEGRARDRSQPVDRLLRGEEREVGAEQQLVLDAVLDRAHERLIEQPAPGDERRDVGVDVRVAPDDGDRLVEPGMAEMGDHDLEPGYRNAISSSRIGRACNSDPARAEGGSPGGSASGGRAARAPRRLGGTRGRADRRSGRSGRACSRRDRGRFSSARARRSPWLRTGRPVRSRSAGRDRAPRTTRHSRSGQRSRTAAR